MNRWEALVRYDSEIRAAAEQVIPYGGEWVTKMGAAFFALKEDRTYLPEIVAGLVEEAEQLLAEERSRRDEEEVKSAMAWLDQFRVTASGERCSEESLGVLLRAINLGYILTKESDGAFALKRGEVTSYLRSNDDILWYSRTLRTAE